MKRRKGDQSPTHQCTLTCSNISAIAIIQKQQPTPHQRLVIQIFAAGGHGHVMQRRRLTRFGVCNHLSLWAIQIVEGRHKEGEGVSMGKAHET